MNDNLLQVLLVDNNSTDHLLVEEALCEIQISAYALTHVKRLDEALQHLQGQHFDAVLLHLGLPDSQGIETFNRMQREHPAIPILILSGINDESVAIQAVQDGAQDYLVKGHIDGETLTRTIRYAIQRKRSQQRLVASEVGYRRLFETAQDGIFVLDAVTGQITDANRSVEVMLGHTVDEFIGKRLWEIGPFRDKAASQAAFATLQEKGYIGYQDLPLATKSGLFVDVEFVSNVYAVGNQSVIQCNIRDITERKQAQQTLLQSEMRLRALVESIDEIIFEFDNKGTYINIWTEDESLLAEPKNKLIGRSVTDVLGETLGRPFVEVFQRVIANGQAESLEYSIDVPKDKRWFLARINPIFTGDGVCSTVCMLARDITESKKAATDLQRANDELETRVQTRTAQIAQVNAGLEAEMAERLKAEEEVQSSRQQLQSLIDAMSTLAAKIAPDGKFLIVNKVAIDASGLSKEVYMRTNFLEGPWWTFDAEVQKRVREAFCEALTGKTINYDESIFVFNQIRTINFGLIPIHDAAGNVEYLIAEGRDITALKQTEEALQQAKQEAERANLAKSDFLSRMSHELRTPLNAILGFSQVLELGKLTPHQGESVQHILKGGRHLLGLINEVLDIARVESGHDDLCLEPVDLAEVVAESRALMHPLAAQHNVHLGETLTLLSDIHILADAQRLKQVLINLLGNSIKYNRPGGSVDISCYPGPGDLFHIAVCDTGSGISQEGLRKLFTPFERLNATNSDIEGTGLGLVLSQRLVTAMGGTMEVESTVGQGSIFTLGFPRVTVPVEMLSGLEDICQCTHTPTPVEGICTVLCIEDNLSNLQLLEAIFEKRPEIKLLAAMQGSIGLDLARQHAPDLILLDLNLPDIQGQEVLAALQQSALTKDIPVIVVSADATPRQIERLLSEGAKAYVTKPIDVAQFLKTFDEWIGLSQGMDGQLKELVS